MAVHTGAFNLIGPINPPLKVINESLFYKMWVEVVALRRANRAVVANFIRDNVIYRIDILTISSLIMKHHLSILMSNNYARSMRSIMLS